MIKKYFQRITFFTLLSFLIFIILIIVVISHQPEEIKTDILYRLVLALVAVIAADVFLKLILKLKTVWVWILQILLLLIAVYIWIVTGE